MKIYNNKFVLFSFIFISTFNLNNQEDYKSINILYTSAFSLLNNTYVVVGEKGIFFYDEEFTIIYKQTNFTDFSLNTGYDTVSMAQFPLLDGGYVLIMVKNIFYVFNNEGTYLKHLISII